MAFSEGFRQRVIEAKGNKCIVPGCNRDPAAESDHGYSISIRPINGDHSDERLENAMPVCNCCNKHIRIRDEPPYRYWHRQLPPEERGQKNTYLNYEGPQLTEEEAAEIRVEDPPEPYSVKYKKHHPELYPEVADNQRQE